MSNVYTILSQQTSPSQKTNLAPQERLVGRFFFYNYWVWGWDGLGRGMGWLQGIYQTSPSFWWLGRRFSDFPSWRDLLVPRSVDRCRLLNSRWCFIFPYWKPQGNAWICVFCVTETTRFVTYSVFKYKQMDSSGKVGEFHVGLHAFCVSAGNVKYYSVLGPAWVGWHKLNICNLVSSVCASIDSLAGLYTKQILNICI